MKLLTISLIFLVFGIAITIGIFLGSAIVSNYSPIDCNIPTQSTTSVQTAYATGRDSTYLHFLAMECDRSAVKKTACDSMHKQVQQLDLKYEYDPKHK